jgi:hypothetical protein
MRRRTTALLATISLIVLGAVGLGSASAPAETRVTDDVSILAQRGFGDTRNSYSWGMAWFKGKLYVGTGRQVSCVEQATLAYYAPNLNNWSTNPSPDVKCPANKWDMDLRAEIWQYTPSTDTWLRVYRAPAIANPRAKGKTVGRDIAYRGMGVVRDGHGRKTLVVSGVTANEFIPELKAKYPARLLHTTDGRHFQASTPSPQYKVSTLSGANQVPIGFRGIEFVDGRIYALASTGLTGDGAIVQITGIEKRHPKFKQVSPTNVAVFELEHYHSHLYAGTGDNTTGYGVYRALDRVPDPKRWTVIVNNGAGRGVTSQSVVSMHVYRDQLYVGSSGWYDSKKTTPATEVIRIRPDNSWDVVVGNPREDHGNIKFPVSGFGDGWGSAFTSHPWRMASQDGALYVGTNDSSTSLITIGGTITQTALGDGYGFDVWATCDGTYWFPVTQNAFSNRPFDFGARTMVATSEGLAIGSANHAMGTTVFMKHLNPCSSGIRGQKAKASTAGAGPRNLLADAQHEGTVLSWDGASAGTTYRVLRADMPTVDLTVKGAPTLPDGSTPDGAEAQVVPAGTAGSQTVGMTGYGRFEAIGTTKGGVFVDRTRTAGAKYAYRIEAVDASGTTLGSSGVQVVPTSGAPLTVGAVERAVAAASSSARVAGVDSGSAADIARLRRASGDDAELRDLVDRLARHLQYGQLAGGTVQKG